MESRGVLAAPSQGDCRAGWSLAQRLALKPSCLEDGFTAVEERGRHAGSTSTV